MGPNTEVDVQWNERTDQMIKDLGWKCNPPCRFYLVADPPSQVKIFINYMAS